MEFGDKTIERFNYLYRLIKPPKKESNYTLKEHRLLKKKFKKYESY